MPSGNPSSSQESERATRAKRIDPRLIAAGWSIAPFVVGKPLADLDGVALTEYATGNGPADYALVLAGQVVGVIEAKKLTLSPEGVLVQAERYAKGLAAGEGIGNWRGMRVPFLYSTNGERFMFHDVRNKLALSRPIDGFHTPDGLREYLGRDEAAACGALAAIPPNTSFVRPYQIAANTAVEQAIADGRRRMMVTMATGTGKTRTMAHQMYRMLKSGLAKRILFLVDRRALAAQTVRAVAAYEAEPGMKFPSLYPVFSQRFRADDIEGEAFDPQVLDAAWLTDPKPGNAFVYICTIQRMAINLFGKTAAAAMGLAGGEQEDDEEGDRLPIPIHAFDVVIADECHRGYTAQQESLWRDTLAHFDAIQIGLTATPASHTLAWFQKIIFRYTYEEAVRAGFLVDYDEVPISSAIRLQGVFLKEGERVGVVDPTTGHEKLDQLEADRQFTADQIEAVITSPDSNRKIMEEIKRYADQHAAKYGRLPKILIFADNDNGHTSHADQVVRLCREVFGQGQDFVTKITGRVDRPLQRIKEFRNLDRPGIAVTVDLLTTGVDIPDLEFLVFMRSVQSRILFEQMVGRGTRRGEHFPDKDHFVVFDCFNGTLLDRFRGATGITMQAPVGPTRTIPEIVEAIWENVDRAYNVGCLVKRFQRIDKQLSGAAREDFKPFVAGGDLAGFANDLPRLIATDFAKTMALLRDPAFQEVLQNFKRPQRTFLVAYEAADTVTSQRRFKIGDGKPDDYLAAFSRWVADHKAEVQAIGILLDHPRDWRPQPLKELRDQLAATREGFREEVLQEAVKMTTGRALVDIISLVKHAARVTEPYLTGAERAAKAISLITAGIPLTTPQREWLDRIRDHLCTNLAIGREDFDLQPVLADHGGWGAANRDFAGKLAVILDRLNEGIAA